MSVISHSSVEVTSLTTSQLRRIYSMRQVRWPNNHPIKVFSLASQHTLHQRFTKESLRLFPYQLDRIWNKLTFSGLGVAPTIVKSQKELLHAVRTTPGAIGYVEDAKEIDNVNIIQIDN